MSATATELVVLDAQLSEPIHVGRHRIGVVPADVVRLVAQLHADYATERTAYRSLHRSAWSRRGWALCAGVLGGLLAWWFWVERTDQLAAAFVAGVLSLWLVHAAIGRDVVAVRPTYKCMGGCGRSLSEPGYCRRCSGAGRRDRARLISEDGI